MTNSERRVQRVRKALDPPGEARDDTWIICELARRLGHDWGHPAAEEAWDELRSLSPMHAGMRYDRLEAHGGLQWPCPDEEHPGSLFLHERLWAEPRRGAARAVQRRRGEAAVRGARRRLPDPPHDRAAGSSPTTPARRRTATARRSTAARRSSSRPRTPSGSRSTEGEVVRVSSRRGAVEAPVRIDDVAAAPGSRS